MKFMLCSLCMSTMCINLTYQLFSFPSGALCFPHAHSMKMMYQMMGMLLVQQQTLDKILSSRGRLNLTSEQLKAREMIVPHLEQIQATGDAHATAKQTAAAVIADLVNLSPEMQVRGILIMEHILASIICIAALTPCSYYILAC